MAYQGYDDDDVYMDDVISIDHMDIKSNGLQPISDRSMSDWKYFLVSNGIYRVIYQPNMLKTLQDSGVCREMIKLSREKALGMIFMIYTLFPSFQDCQQHIQIYLNEESINPAAVWSNNSEYTVIGLPSIREPSPSKQNEGKENWVAFLFSLSRDPAKQYTIVAKGPQDKIIFQFDKLEFYEGLLLTLSWFQLKPKNYLTEFHDYDDKLVI